MNENLRQALLRARLREQDVAARLGVDPKTVRRWIEGRVPYPANRAALTDLLAMDETDLWPEIDSHLAPQARPEELVAVFPHRWAVPRRAWARFFNSAGQEIGILAYSALFLAEDTGILSLITEKARRGVSVRLALGDPESAQVVERGAEEGISDAMPAKVRNALALYRPLLATPNVEIRLHRTVLYNSLFLADDEIFVNQHTYGNAAAHSPVFHLRGMSGSGMTAVYVDSFDRIWAGASDYA
jgi:transcriptional regulator with XRE-family HTH domain